MKISFPLILVMIAIHIVSGPPAQAQIARAMLLKDIRPGSSDGIGRDFERLVSNGKYVFFTADDGVHGLQLWRSDGTARGTIMLTSSTTGLISHDSELVADSRGRVYFGGNDPDHGFELWTSDGTAAGTRLAIDLNTGPPSGLSPHLIPLGDQVVFAGTTGTESGIWLSDGTWARTWLIKDHNSGPDILHMINLESIQNGMIYYTGLGTGGGMLWKSDGVTASAVTQHLSLFNSMLAPEIIEFKGKIFFEQLMDTGMIAPRMADTASLGNSTLLHGDFSVNEPYGTSPLLFKNKVYVVASCFPTHPTATIYCADVDAATVTSFGVPGQWPGSLTYEIDGTPQALVDAGDRMLLWTSQGLWRLDGTAQGCELLKAFRVQDPDALAPSINFRYNANHLAPVPAVVRIPGQRRWVFGAEAADGHGFELWWTDGTREGTALLADLNPASSGFNDSDPWNFTVLGNKLFLSATDPTHGRELWLLVLPTPRTPVEGWDQFQ